MTATNERGFTLIELIVTLGLFALILTIATINMIRPQISASIDTTVLQLVSDLKHQQLKSMNGAQQSQATAQQHGIYFSTNSYTIFNGTTYSVSDPQNLVINLNGVTFTDITFPSSTILFSRLSGEVANFSAGNNTVVASHSSGVQKTLTINQVGTVTVN